MNLQILRAFRLVYLSTPYSLFQSGLEAAAEEAAKLEAKLVKNGVKAYSPISHTHPLGKRAEIDLKNHQFWLEYDEPFMEAAEAMVIGELPGWQDSYGCNYEQDIFRAAGKPVFFIHPLSLEVRS